MDSVFAYTISLLLEEIIIYYYCVHKMNVKKSTRFTTIAFLILFIILFLLTFFHNPFINLLGFAIGNVICIYITFYCSFGYSCITGALICSVMTITEIIAELSVRSFFQTYEYPDITDAKIAFCFIISKASFFIIMLLLSYTKSKSKNNQTNIYQIVIVVFSFLLLFVLSYIIQNIQMNTKLVLLFEIECVIILIIDLFMIWLQEYIQKNQELLDEANIKLYLEKLSNNYYELLKEHDENQKILIHDIRNHLLSMQKISKDNQNDTTKDYINELLNSSALNDNYKPTLCYNLNLILSSYYSKSSQLGINFIVDSNNADMDFIPPIQLTSLFCNLLDNAFTAACACKNPFIHLIIRQKENSDIITISLVNSCIVCPKTDENGHYLTIKNNKAFHGYGLKSITNVIKNYRGELSTFFDESDYTFHTIILIHSKNN